MARVSGTSGRDRLIGTATSDVLLGLGERDRLVGLGGNDVLDGGAGADRALGGLGNDVYRVDQGNDAVIELAGEGRDRVVSAASFILPDNVENLVLTGTAAINGRGNGLGSVVNGEVVYDPGAALFNGLGDGQTASDSFTYTIADAAGATASATVSVTVTGQNDAPVAIDDTGATTENAAVTIAVLGNDSDPDAGDTRTASVGATSMAGAALNVGSGENDTVNLFTADGWMEQSSVVVDGETFRIFTAASTTIAIDDAAQIVFT